MKVWIKRWGPAVLIMAVIFFASGTPGDSLPRFGTPDFLTKKGGHMLGYALLAAAYLRGLNYGKSCTKLPAFAAVSLAIAYAMSDELHQKFTEGRSPSLMDVWIDAAGACLGIGACCLARFFSNRRMEEKG